MRPSKFTEAQMMAALRQVRDGTAAAQVCRELRITETTFYRWRAKYERLGPEQSSELRQLRDENHKLKEIIADLMLEAQRAAERRSRR